MKRSLLALAIGVAALPLVAQAAPELYGRLNVSLDNIASHESTLPFGGPLGDRNTFGQAGTSWDVNSSHNWVGIKGDVPLYDQNLKAIYQIERGVDVTGGSSDLSARNTYVGLAGDNWGKVFLGTYDSVVKQAEGKVDQFNNTDADMMLYIGGQNRANNTINYQSPSYSGLTFNAQVIPGEGRPNLRTDAGDSEHSLANAYGVSVNFTQDTFWGNLAYEKGVENIFDVPVATAGYLPSGIPVSLLCAANPAACGDINVSTARLTAGVDIGNISLGLLAQQRDAGAINTPSFLVPAGTKSDVRRDYLVSGSIAVTERLKLKAQAADASGYFTMENDDRKIRSYTVGADYALAKNVTGYVLYSNNTISGTLVVPTMEDHSKYNIAAVGLSLNF